MPTVSQMWMNRALTVPNAGRQPYASVTTPPEQRPVINRDRIVQTFLELVAIDSPSGEEDAIAAELERRFRDLGLEVAQDAAGNVLGRRDGDGEPVLLSAHMDTVEPGRGIKPTWDGPDIIRSDGTTILGADNKAGCAVILEVIQSAIEDGATTRPIEVAISRGEEVGLVGAANMDYSRLAAKVADAAPVGVTARKLLQSGHRQRVENGQGGVRILGGIAAQAGEITAINLRQQAFGV